ncbi:tRNA 4-thiouridine(8) synthase ThiI [Patescibacteria group bacterium]|nr:tRNA 4-thiouridine(8) synthase ThiI [Patescibacteria group bacterium]MBU1612917.1 tRNA 4-thiouridine(8) synthase ThiI [Patescibacteria group bacterium]
MNVIAHLDEIFLKGGNQRMFVRRMITNLKALFPSVIVSRSESTSLWIENLGEEELDRLANIPGLSKLAPAVACENSMVEIEKLLDKMDFTGAKSFRISATRSLKKYPISSKNIEIQLGAFVARTKKLKVDLENHDVKIHVDIGRDFARVYTNIREAIGGLPTGSLGKVLCLLSGGIDSPVASYEMMKRGAEIELVHFQNQTQVTEEVSEKIFDLAKALASIQPVVKLNIVPFADIQRQIIMKIPAEYRMITSRRLMMKIAENCAKENGVLALATGDSLGQVASQTLENLNCIYSATDMLKLTPLIGRNKAEIMKIARKIGTLAISERPYEDCCSLFVAKHPQTRAKLAYVEEMESGLDLPALDKTKIISYHISIN